MPPQKEKGEPIGSPRLRPPLQTSLRRSPEREQAFARHQLQRDEGSAAQLRAEPPVAVAVALARRGLISGIRRGGQWVPRVSGLLLLVVGAYVSWYGAWELRVLDGGDPSDPVIELAARVQATLAEWVRAITP